MGISDHLTCLLRNLYADQEATVRTGHGTTDWFQIGKGVCQGWILSFWLFNLYSKCCSVIRLCPTLCDPMDCSMPGFPVLYHLLDQKSTSCEMLGWMKHQLESRLPGEVSITSDTQITPPLWQKAKRN